MAEIETDYVGHHSGEDAFSSRLTGETTTVRVRQKLVDATYLRVVGAGDAHAGVHRR